MEFEGTPLVFRADALDRGFTDHELRAARRSRELLALRPGAYVRAADLAEPDSVAQHRLAVLATASASPGTVVSHVHVARLSTEDVAVVEGVPATSPPRTVIDLARTVPFESAVMSGDHALASGLVTRAELDEALARCRGRRGAAQAAKVVAFVDGRSESVGESRSRVPIHRLRLPAPNLQRVITDEEGEIGRVDFHFEKERAVGEFDGLGKYTEHLRLGQTTQQALIEEKFREDRIRGAGYGVARWGWRELSTPAEVARRLRRAFG